LQFQLKDAPHDAMPTKSKAPPPVSAEQTASEAFATILRYNFDYLRQWEETARTWDDIEGVHQLRVTIRRMRSALTLFQNALPKDIAEPVAAEMRWIAGELGLARDLDVFISEGLTAVAAKLPLDGADKLEVLAQQRRARAYEEQVRAMLDSERYRRFKQDFSAWLEERAWEQPELTKKQSKRLSMNIVPYARKLLDKQERRVLSAGSHVDRDDATAMHQLRIECKKLRYASEFFRPLFAGMDTFISHMKGLQDLLGTMNDVAVTRHLLDELLRGQTDQEVSVYAGGLIGWRSCDFCHMLVCFDGYWEELVEAKHPWWKKAVADQPSEAAK
jgi:CHAD domain-containing protein